MKAKAFALTLCALPLLLATVGTAAPLGPLDLLVNDAGEAWISNPTMSAVDFDGYEIVSDAGNLNPPGWFSLTDRGETDWAEFSTTELLLTESVTPPDSPAFFTLDAESMLSLGTPVDPGTPLEDLAFNFTVPGGEAFSGDVIPEPTILALLSVGGLAVLRRR